MRTLIATFWISCVSILYVYALYPLILLLLTRGRRYVPPKDLRDEHLPAITMLACACNEEQVIETKLKNCLQLDYPPEKSSFVFVADGCTDQTEPILHRYEGSRIRVATHPHRRGKINALRAGLPLCRGEVIVFSDANTFYRPDVLRKLARHFADPTVGVVSGDVRLLPSAEQFGAGEGLYYRYERSLQIWETAIWSTVAIDGAMYALRLSSVVFPDYDEVPDDFVIAMNVARQGLRLVYDPEAIAEEPPTPTTSQEFKRKVRIVAHGIQSVLERQGIPHFRQKRLLWVYLSHKVMRWTAPIFLVSAAASSLVLAFVSPIWIFAVILQLAFYALAILSWRLPALQSRIFRVPYYFSLMNLAALIGLYRGMKKAEKVIGIKTDRVAV